MSQLDSWARAWAELEKRNAKCFDELSRHVDGLSSEHAQCDDQRMELERRAKTESTRYASEIAWPRMPCGRIRNR